MALWLVEDQRISQNVHLARLRNTIRCTSCSQHSAPAAAIQPQMEHFEDHHERRSLRWQNTTKGFSRPLQTEACFISPCRTRDHSICLRGKRTATEYHRHEPSRPSLSLIQGSSQTFGRSTGRPLCRSSSNPRPRPSGLRTLAAARASHTICPPKTHCSRLIRVARTNLNQSTL